MMNPLDERPISPELLNGVENLIRYYLIRRRETVIQAMLELNPRIVIGLCVEGIVGIRDIPAYHRFYEEEYAIRETKQVGVWRNEWHYFLHGYGCRVIHQETKERFDWDLGEPNMFYMPEFFHHLLWRIQNASDKDVDNYLVKRNFIEQEGLKTIFLALEKQNRLDYIEWDGYLERVAWGDWRLKNIIFDNNEPWEKLA